MALIKCPECGKEISDTARKCPNCGFKAKNINKNGGKKVVIISSVVFLSLLFIIGIIYLNSNTKKNEVYETAIVNACIALKDRYEVDLSSIDILECRAKVFKKGDTDEDNIYVYVLAYINDEYDEEFNEYSKGIYVCDTFGKMIKYGMASDNVGNLEIIGSKPQFSDVLIDDLKNNEKSVIDASNLSKIKSWKKFDSKKIKEKLLEQQNNISYSNNYDDNDYEDDFE